LFSIDSHEYVDRMIHEASFNRCKARLSAQAYDTIVQELASRFDADEVQTSSWIPGSDWTGTIWEPIYSKACMGDVTQAALFFGLLVWRVALDHPEVWGFGRYQLNGKDIAGMTYFRLRTPPPRAP
tara:strand:+ start:3477 stop:3854 length:378 start_codon:yes stop_codon:yes gene_type:complete